MGEASESFSKFCSKHGLVLLESVRVWRQNSSNDRLGFAEFERLLIDHAQCLNEVRWLETLASEVDFPPVLPTPDLPRLDTDGVSRTMDDELQDLYAIVLQRHSVGVVGILNPWLKSQVESCWHKYFPDQKVVVLSLTPHAYALYSGERGRVQPSDELMTKEFPTWDGFDQMEREGDLCPLPGQYLSGTLVESDVEVIILRKTSTHAWVAVPRLGDSKKRENLLQLIGRTIHWVRMFPDEFQRLRAQLERRILENVVSAGSQTRVVQTWNVSLSMSDYPVKLFEKLLNSAIGMGASDIHLDPKTDRVRVRFRVDGQLIEQAPIEIQLYFKLLQRIKLQGGMMHDQTGIAQDGAGSFVSQGQRHDLRYSISVLQESAEAVVIRIFSATIPRIEDLRISLKEQETLRWFLRQDCGMLITTGPTGSGKTTTLYACLRALDSTELSLATLEQPVEKYFENAKQIEVNSSKGVTFHKALETVLRQDPDVIMVGEIRDSDSAKIAIQSALTGHQVLTTLHANDAVGVIERLSTSFGVDRLTLAYALKLSIAQRLVRRVCPHCSEMRSAVEQDFRGFPEMDVAQPVIAIPRGCPACRGTGFLGRLCVMEMLPIDSVMVSMLEENARPSDLRKENEKRGFTRLVTQATRLYFTGQIDGTSVRSFLG